jgi:alkaline phosphatase
LILAVFVLPIERTADSPSAAERQANSQALPKYVFLFLADSAGITHMEITRLYNRFVHNALGMMVANNTQAYWVTTAHTNQPVFVAALGAGAEKFKGYQDNADFGRNLKALLESKKPH